MPTSGSATDDKVGIMTMLGFQCCVIVFRKTVFGTKIWYLYIFPTITLPEWESMFRRHIKSVVPEVGIKGRDKKLHPADTMGCNYLSLFLIPAPTQYSLCGLDTQYTPRIMRTARILTCFGVVQHWLHLPTYTLQADFTGLGAIAR